MAIDADVRITVLRRLRHEDLLGQYATSVWSTCDRLADGQVFVASNVRMPEGFCSWAWADIQKYVLTLARGGNLRGTREGTFVTCCTDGFRPVLFLLERIEPQA